MKLIFFLLIVSVIFGCGDPLNLDVNPETNGKNPLEGNTYSISSFLSGDQEKTVEFAGYNFNFYSNTTVYAIQNADTAQGSWYITDIGTQKRITLNFGSRQVLENLNHNWRVVEAFQNGVKLQFDGDATAIEVVQFAKR